MRRTRIEELIQQGNLSAGAVKRAIDDPDRFIAATQLGITIASLGLGWLGEPALVHLIEPLIRLFPAAWADVASHSISAGIAFAIITCLHVVIGELAPKSIALQNPEGTSLVVARPTLWTERLFKPAIWLLNGAGNSLLKLVGVEPAAGHQLVHSVEELKMLVSASEAGGVIEDAERDMLHAVFDFGDLRARAIMVPRTEMAAVSADATLDDVIKLAIQHPFTKFPVYEGNLDHILGIVHTKDLVRVRHAAPPKGASSPAAARLEGPRQGAGDMEAPVAPGKAGSPTSATVRGIMREVLFVPETIRVDDLLQQFRERRQHIAIMLDEYGGTAGLVTLEDVMEQIIGEVRDPFDKAAPAIQRLPDGSALVDGLTPIDEVNEHFGLKLADPNYETIAGFVLGRLGRIASVGDETTADGVRLRVEAMDGLRIARLSLFIGK